MTSTETSLTHASHTMAVLCTTPEAVYLRLPRELQLPAPEGGCSCGHCDNRPMWDTLVVPTTGDRNASTFTVHMPDGAVAGFVAHMRRRHPGQVRDARGQ